MKPTFLAVLLVSVSWLCSSPFAADAEPPKYIPVASYLNSREMNERVGNRVDAILHAQKIQSVAAGSAGMTVSVPADRAAEALQLLAKAIKAEKLQLTLLVPKGDRYIVVTPDGILEPKKAQ